MSSERMCGFAILALAICLLALVATGCSQPCQRHSDCGDGKVCAVSGHCMFPPANAGPTDAEVEPDAAGGDGGADGPSLDGAAPDGDPADAAPGDAQPPDGTPADAGLDAFGPISDAHMEDSSPTDGALAMPPTDGALAMPPTDGALAMPTDGMPPDGGPDAEFADAG